ncbi:MAG: hypothetical protein ACJA2O_003993 [Candidatus Azotimanducaceae bacterium]
MNQNEEYLQFIQSAFEKEQTDIEKLFEEERNNYKSLRAEIESSSHEQRSAISNCVREISETNKISIDQLIHKNTAAVEELCQEGRDHNDATSKSVTQINDTINSIHLSYQDSISKMESTLAKNDTNIRQDSVNVLNRIEDLISKSEVNTATRVQRLDQALKVLIPIVVALIIGNLYLILKL